MTVSECSAIAFYGAKVDPFSLRAFFDHVVEFFATHDRPPEWISVREHGGAGKYRPFSTFGVTRGEFDVITSLEIMSPLNQGEGKPGDYAISAFISAAHSELVIVARSSIAPLDERGLLPLATSIVETVEPEYGIGYTRDRHLGPDLYALGMSQGLGFSEVDEAEALSIAFWTNAVSERIWRRGILRGVYEWNFLAPPQLSTMIDGVPLSQWVGKNSERGILRPMSRGLHLWEVQTPKLPEVRRALWNAGLLFNWPDHIEGAKDHPRANKVRAPS